jgi:hypothetical protein
MKKEGFCTIHIHQNLQKDLTNPTTDCCHAQRLFRRIEAMQNMDYWFLFGPRKNRNSLAVLPSLCNIPFIHKHFNIKLLTGKSGEDHIESYSVIILIAFLFITTCRLIAEHLQI